MNKSNRLILIIKYILVYLITMLAFVLASKLIHGAGNMPQFMIDAYDSSIFVKTGTKTIAMVGLCSAILAFLLWNFHFIKDRICSNKVLNGLIYGSSFGVVWFFGFMEMNTINNDNLFVHIQSGFRDLILLSIFGLSVGLLLTEKKDHSIRRSRSTFWAIPLVSIGFAIFHTIQLSITFQKVSSHQKIDSIIDVVWLLGFGAWIGFMYVIFVPGRKVKNRSMRTLFFAFMFWGSDWILYNLFYNIFLDIPLMDLAIRCLFDCTGVFIGLLSFELLNSRLKQNDTNGYKI